MSEVGQSGLLNVVYFLRFEWDSSFRRPYHLEMSKHCRMLGVEFPVTLDLPFRYGSSFKQWLTQKPRLRRINENLYLYRPFSLVCYYLSFRFPFLAPLNRWILARSLKPVLQQLEMDNVVVMINHPMMEYVIGTLGEKVLCYEVFDEYTEEYHLPSRLRRRLIAAEKRVLQAADVLFTSSRQQMENRRELNENIHFVPNAVDFEPLAEALRPETPVPQDVQRLPHPRLGLVGNMDDRLDLELLSHLADRFPHGSIVIIGRKQIRTPVLEGILARPNVHYLGFKDYADLPAYMKGIDVGLLLYKIDPYTRGIYPNKLHQYLAAGKPVVSTALPELESLRGIIAWADTYDEFEAQVNAAVRDLGTDVDRRIRVAQENSIANRTLEKVQILKDCLT